MRRSPASPRAASTGHASCTSSRWCCPSDVSLSSLDGSVSPDVQTRARQRRSSGSSGSDLRGNIQGPALEISGCAPGQDAVAGFVAALEDIDGVTRVGLESLEAIDSASGSGIRRLERTGSTDCQAGPRTASSRSSSPSTRCRLLRPRRPRRRSHRPLLRPLASTDQSQVADGQAQEDVAKASARAQISKAQKRKQTILGGGG